MDLLCSSEGKRWTFACSVWPLQVHIMKRDNEGCICFTALHPLQAGQRNTVEQHWQCPLYHVCYTNMLIYEADVV